MRYQNLKPILVAEGKKPPEPELFGHKGIQAGEFEDLEEAKLARNLNLEFRMVIDDWANTPAYGMMMKGYNQRTAFLAGLNKFTLRRIT